MRRTPSRAVDPHQAHQRLARTQYGVENTRDVASDLQAQVAGQRTGDSFLPRITGRTTEDQVRSVISVLVRLGLAVDETTGPDVEGL